MPDTPLHLLQGFFKSYLYYMYSLKETFKNYYNNYYPYFLIKEKYSLIEEK